jgi:NADH:ubiquinone oxidoreductase subunit 6 (subunit J)
MRLSSLTPTQLSGAQIALAVALAVVGFLLLLPRPRGRFVPGGVAFLIASASGLGVWLYSTFGKPASDTVGTVLFVLFSAGALGFGTVLVVQRNPARGAIAFAFVILSTCGLFLLLGAPFLMAATIVIYAGAIIVTFLFVLMLSQVQGPSDENDRSREPLFGGLAGFAFTGLVLFAVYLSADGTGSAKSLDMPKAAQVLPAVTVTGDERTTLLRTAEELAGSAEGLKALDERLGQINSEIARLPAADQAGQNALRERQLSLLQEWLDSYSRTRDSIIQAGTAIRLRLTIEIGGRNEVLRTDEQAKAVRGRATEVLDGAGSIVRQVEGEFITTRRVPVERVESVRRLREEVLLLAGAGELPARNVANIGFVLYANHLLAVELAGTLLLVATVGAVAIAQRKGSTA